MANILSFAMVNVVGETLEEREHGKAEVLFRQMLLIYDYCKQHVYYLMCDLIRDDFKILIFFVMFSFPQSYL